MNIEKIQNNESQFLALTSLYLAEFEELYVVFERCWLKWYKHYTFRMKRRRKPLTYKQLIAPTKTLSTNREKLFFILYMFKTNPLQQAAAASFEMDQGQVSKWVKVLMPILEESIEQLHLQPARTMEELVRFFRQRQQQDEPPMDKPKAQSLHLDTSARPINRNVDQQTQRHDFSGKHHQHSVKNTVVSDEFQFIHFLGYTWRGAIHDKRMAVQEIPALQKSCFQHLWLSKDAGYEGYHPPGVHLLQPYKAKRNKPLTDQQNQYNKWMSSIRVVVENAIGAMKRLRIVKDRFRGKVRKNIDQIINIAAGLHNFRVVQRKSTCARTCVHDNLFFLHS